MDKLQTTVLWCSGGQCTRPRNIPAHHHSEQWQIESVLGKWDLTSKNNTYTLDDRNLVLLPPRTYHGIRHNGEGETYCSIKFLCSTIEVAPIAVLIPSDSFTENWRRCVLSLMTRKGNMAAHASDSVASLVDALLPRILRREQLPQHLPWYVSEALEYIHSSAGSAVTVEHVANYVKVRRGYLTTGFSYFLGQTVKQCIDNNRVELAKRALLYSDLPIDHIAEQLDFPDIFSFSRFFKRVSGKSPTEFRKKSPDN